MYGNPRMSILPGLHGLFFHAEFTRVNGELFVVPQQPWGWVPAHMGTWVWMKWGWTWVPGSAFSSGICSGTSWGLYGSWLFPNSLTDWMYYGYGGYDLYYIYRDYGVRVWREHYQKQFNTYKKEPGVKKFPKEIRKLMAKLNKAPVKVVKERLGTAPRSTMIGMKKVETFLKSVTPAVRVNTDKKPVSTRISSNKISASKFIPREGKGIKLKAIEKVSGDGVRVPLKGFRDWNPDSRWASSNGYNIVYSSKNNEVVCPNLRLASKTITSVQRASLKGKSSGFRGRSSTQSGSSSSNGRGSNNDNSNDSSSSSRGSGSHGGGNRGGNTAQKQ